MKKVSKVFVDVRNASRPFVFVVSWPGHSEAHRFARPEEAIAAREEWL